MEDQEEINEFLKDFYPCDADNSDSHSSIKGVFSKRGFVVSLALALTAFINSPTFLSAVDSFFSNTPLN